MATLETNVKTAITNLANGIKTERARITALSGTGWFDLSVFTRSSIQKQDMLLLGDDSDTTADAGGTLKQISVTGLAEVQRRMLVNYSMTDTAAGFATDTYVAGSGIVLPDAPVAGSMYHCLVKISKTAAGAGAPSFNLRVGSGVVGDTSRAFVTFAAGSAAADVAMVELWFVYTGASDTALTIEGNGNARNNLATTGFSGLSKNATALGVSHDPSAMAGSTIGVSYNGGTSAAHTIQFVRADWNP
jgi:hypothetical protein